jgi:hypothetical protein
LTLALLLGRPSTTPNMRLRLSSIDEFQLLTCFKHGLWGAKMDRFPGWEQGDYLLLTVNKSLAALAQIAGKPFKSDKEVWDNDSLSISDTD